MKEELWNSELQDEIKDGLEHEDPDDEVEMSVEELTRKYPKAASCWRESHCVSEEEKKHIRKRYVKLYAKRWAGWAVAFSCIGCFAGVIGELMVETKTDWSFYTGGIILGACILVPIIIYFLYILNLYIKANKFDFDHVKEVIYEERVLLGGLEWPDIWEWDEEQNVYCWWPTTKLGPRLYATSGDILYFLEKDGVYVPK